MTREEFLEAVVIALIRRSPIYPNAREIAEGAKEIVEATDAVRTAISKTTNHGE